MSMYKNEYTLNKKLITEYVFDILCKDIIVCGAILSVFAFGMFLLDTSSYVGLIVCFISLLFMAFCPIFMIKNLEENSKRLNNGKIEKTIVEFNDNIIMNEGKVHLEFEYSQIKKIKKTKNFIVLMISNKSAILVYKDGFIEGNIENFYNFINEKVNMK